MIKATKGLAGRLVARADTRRPRHATSAALNGAIDVGRLDRRPYGSFLLEVRAPLFTNSNFWIDFGSRDYRCGIARSGARKGGRFGGTSTRVGQGHLGATTRATWTTFKG